MSSGEHGGVWVFSEDVDVAMELLGKGRELADKRKTELCAVTLGQDARSHADRCMAHGADTVYVSDDPRLEAFYVIPYTDVLTRLIEEHHPEIVLVGATKRGRELAPRIASRLRAAYVTDCVDLDIDDEGRLLTKRWIYSGSTLATEVCLKKPQIATIPPRKFPPPEEQESRGKAVGVELEISDPRIKILGMKKKEAGHVNIEESEVIVSGGRGVKNKEDFKIIKALADALGGQVGCSRPIAADYKWLPEDHWVGLSGHKVTPKLYVACGISGQIQHLAGIRDAKTIVAINSDSEAPIFEACDYGVVGDLYQVVPAMTSIINQSKKA